MICIYFFKIFLINLYYKGLTRFCLSCRRHFNYSANDWLFESKIIWFVWSMYRFDSSYLKSFHAFLRSKSVGIVRIDLYIYNRLTGGFRMAEKFIENSDKRNFSCSRLYDNPLSNYLEEPHLQRPYFPALITFTIFCKLFWKKSNSLFDGLYLTDKQVDTCQFTIAISKTNVQIEIVL